MEKYNYDLELIIKKLNEGKSRTRVGVEIGIKEENKSTFCKRLKTFEDEGLITHYPGFWRINKKGANDE